MLKNNKMSNLTNQIMRITFKIDKISDNKIFNKVMELKVAVVLMSLITIMDLDKKNIENKLTNFLIFFYKNFILYILFIYLYFHSIIYLFSILISLELS